MRAPSTGTSEPAFLHQGCLYGSDSEFLATAVPFIEEGLAAGEPVLAVTTSANLELLWAELGPAARGMDCAESVYFGRRPAQRIAAFHRYWQRNSGSPGHVRILAEPVWAGRSEPEIRAWKQMEAGLNLVFAGTRIWMICPYDSRVLRPDILSGACRTHPARAAGNKALPCTDYADPRVTAASLEPGPLPAPPAGVTPVTFTGDLAGLRSRLGRTAAAHGLAHDDAALFVIAAAEAANFLCADGKPAAIAVWEQPGAIVCDLCQPGRDRRIDPLTGLWPPDPDNPRQGDGLWLARQICRSVQMSSTDSGSTIRLRMSTSRLLG